MKSLGFKLILILAMVITSNIYADEAANKKAVKVDTVDSRSRRGAYYAGLGFQLVGAVTVGGGLVVTYSSRSRGHKPALARAFYQMGWWIVGGGLVLVAEGSITKLKLGDGGPTASLSELKKAFIAMADASLSIPAATMEDWSPVVLSLNGNDESVLSDERAYAMASRTAADFVLKANANAEQVRNDIDLGLPVSLEDARAAIESAIPGDPILSEEAKEPYLALGETFLALNGVVLE